MNSQMSPDLFNLIRPRLDAYEFKERKEWLQQGKCPNCDKKELFTHAQSPWVLKCNRLDSCGFEAHAKELWPELFTDWSKRASFLEESKPKEQQNPNAAADLYLKEGRGFNLSLIKDWYSQQSYIDNRTLEGTATVRFTAFNGHWERLIDRPERFKGQKALFSPGLKYGGQWWQPPSFNDELVNEIKELWIVEGIFDAIALLHNGVQAVSIMSCGNYPRHALADLERVRGDKRGITLVWALDRGTAGEKHLKEFYQQATKDGWTCEAALPPLRKNQPDWNDLHLRGRLQAEYLDSYKYEGALLVAKTPTEKALRIHKRSNKSMFPFNHDKKLYFFKIDYPKYELVKKRLLEEESFKSTELLEEKALKQSDCVQPIAPCNPQILYFQRDEMTDQSWYYFRIERPEKPDVKGTFQSAELSSPSEFKKRLLHLVDGGLYTGDGMMLNQFITDQFKDLKHVETINFVGYAKEFDAYLLGDVAVQNGEVIKINDDDYFELADKRQVKSLSKSLHLEITTDEKKYTEEWVKWIWQAFGAKGMVALTYWFGSFFAEQIRSAFKSYPFLEMVGDAGAGKTTLLEFLWKLTGRREYEGFEPGKSTNVGRARNFEQVSNMPVAIIEGDYGGNERLPHVRTYNFDETKPLYNGRAIRAIGNKNSGNDTKEPPFRAALVIAQNNPVMASDATMQRICHLFFKLSDQSDKSAVAAKNLENIPLEEVSHFVLKAIKSEKQTMAILNEMVEEYRAEILRRESVSNRRVAYNHAQLLALVDALAEVINLNDQQVGEIHNFIYDMAIQRQQAITADCQAVQEFWEAYEYMHVPGSISDLNHSRNIDQISINLNHFYTIAKEKGQQVPDISLLRRVIKSSIRHKFIDYKNVASAMLKGDRAIRCYVFEAKSNQTGDE